MIDPDERTTSQVCSQLYDAAFRHEVEAVRLLLASGASVSGDSYDKKTALHAICWNAGSCSGNTVVQIAEMLVSGDRTSGNTRTLQIIEMLLGAGADVNAADAKGDTPLHEAVSGDWANATAVRALLRHGALADPLNARGESPLMVAVSDGMHQVPAGSESKLLCVKMLIEAGADPTRHDSSGSDVLSRANATVSVLEKLNPKVHFRPTPEKLVRVQRRLDEAVSRARECVTLLVNAIHVRG